MLQQNFRNEIEIWIKTKYKLLKYAFFIIIVIEICLLFLGILVKIYKVDVSSSITNLGGISTLITTIIILFTLFEMQRQRKTTYQPQVIVVDGFTIINYPNKLDPLDFEWTSKEIKLDELIDFESINDFDTIDYPKIKLFNIGMGFAKKITIKWSVDFNYLQDSINDLANRKGLDFTISCNENSIDFRKESKPHGGCVYGTEDTCRAYMLPIHIKEEITEIEFPYGFCHIYPIFVQFMGYKSELTPNHYYLNQSPLIKMIITYFDIGNNMYSKKYLINFSPTAGYVRFDDNLKTDGYYNRVEVCYRVKELE